MAAPVQTPLMPTSLSPTSVRTLYLRGIDLGPAWSGPGADAAIAQLLNLSLAQAESLMNIQFQTWRVQTLPEATLTPGLDYDVAGALLPFVPLLPTETHYQLTLGYHDVQQVQRVQLYAGMAGAPPAPVLTPLPLETLAYDRLAERVLVPRDAVPAPDTVQGWAVDYTIGYGRLPPEVVTWVMLQTAIQVLALAGSGEAISHGLSAESLTQDGIIESVRYAGQGLQAAMGGVYAGPIQILQHRLDDIDLVKLRLRYQGSHFLVSPGAGLRALTDPRI
jgi:hypothetical protein